MELEEQHAYLREGREHTLMVEEERKVLCSERPKGKVLWLWNFHPSLSHTSVTVRATLDTQWKVVLSSDQPCFGGHDRVQMEAVYGGAAFDIYLPNRTLIVLARHPKEQ